MNVPEQELQTVPEHVVQLLEQHLATTRVEVALASSTPWMAFSAPQVAVDGSEAVGCAA